MSYKVTGKIQPGTFHHQRTKLIITLFILTENQFVHAVYFLCEKFKSPNFTSIVSIHLFQAGFDGFTLLKNFCNVLFSWEDARLCCDEVEGSTRAP